MALGLILAIKFGDNLRKNEKIYYYIAYLLAISDILYRLFFIRTFRLSGIISQVEKSVAIGALSGAMFVIVMYAGALDNKKMYTKKLMSVRAQMSILASVFFLPHTIPNCISFFRNISKTDFSTFSSKVNLVLALTAIVSLIIILPLWITSYKKIRKKMSAKKWKSLQRLAYLVYFLIYAHISILFLALGRKQYDKFAIYTIVFGVYVFLRLKKYFNKKVKLKKA